MYAFTLSSPSQNFVPKFKLKIEKIEKSNRLAKISCKKKIRYSCNNLFIYFVWLLLYLFIYFTPISFFLLYFISVLLIYISSITTFHLIYIYLFFVGFGGVQNFFTQSTQFNYTRYIYFLLLLYPISLIIISTLFYYFSKYIFFVLLLFFIYLTTIPNSNI